MIHYQIEKAKQYITHAKYQTAITLLNRVLRDEPNNEAANFELGKIHFIGKDYLRAARRLRTALRLNNKNTNARLLLAKTYKSQRRYVLAKTEYLKALGQKGDKGQIYKEIGLLYWETGRLRYAVKQLKKALRLEYDRDVSDDISRIYRELACRHRKEKKHAQTIRELKLALKFDPSRENKTEMANLFKERADGFYNGKKYRKALQEYRLSLRYIPDDKNEIHMKLADIYEKRGNYTGAVSELKKYSETNKKDGMINFKLGNLYRTSGNVKAAAREFKKALRSKNVKGSAFLANKVLNEMEISLNETILKSKPIGLGVTLTTKCNLKCIMCPDWRLDWTIPSKALREIRNCFPYLEQLYWRGGEVFLMKGFEDLFEEAASYPNLHQNIDTNGTVLGDKWAKILSRRNVTITFSIDGASAGTYERIRRGASFGDLLKKINILNSYKTEYNKSINEKSSRMKTGMNFVLMDLNFSELKKISGFAARCKFDFVRLFPMKGERAGAVSSEESQNIEQLVPAISNLETELKGKNITFINRLNSAAGKRRTYKNGNAILNNGLRCRLPWQCLLIFPGGSVRPSCFCKKDAGNLNRNSIEQIWNNSKMQEYRKISLDPDNGLCNPQCFPNMIPEEYL